MKARVDTRAVVVDPVEQMEDERVDVARRLLRDRPDALRQCRDLLLEIELRQGLDDLLADRPLRPDADRPPARRRGVRPPCDGDDVVEERLMIDGSRTSHARRRLLRRVVSPDTVGSITADRAC